MLYTGQRRSDVHRMTWADVNAGTIRVAQQKTGHKLTIPLHRELLMILTAGERNHATIINTEYGKPFTVDGFSQWLRDAITAAGLPLDCQPHGLRKAAGRRLAEAGCTAHEIMAVLGHKMGRGDHVIIEKQHEWTLRAAEGEVPGGGGAPIRLLQDLDWKRKHR